MNQPKRLKWLEISPDYRCNNRCLGCFSNDDAGGSMSGREIADYLRLGRSKGAESLWLGGGEPTLRKDLLPTVRAAKRVGYQTIKLQTNGMLLAYPEFAHGLFAAGVTQVNFSIKGATAETHDRLTGTPGCFDLMLRGLAVCRERRIDCQADVLVYQSNVGELSEMVRKYSELGVSRFNLWLLSAAGNADPSITSELVRISDAMPHIQAAMDLKLSDRADFITSLHTPPCTVPESHAACRFHAAELRLLVGNPGGYHFMLEDSEIEGGVYFERCAGCRLRSGCGGARRDYVARFGDAEFQPPIAAESDADL